MNDKNRNWCVLEIWVWHMGKNTLLKQSLVTRIMALFAIKYVITKIGEKKSNTNTTEDVCFPAKSPKKQSRIGTTHLIRAVSTWSFKEASAPL